MMLGRKGKVEKLALQLPAVAQPELPVPPSVRIMQIAGLRSWVYGLLVANAIALLSAAGFYALMLSRIDEIPYVADGSFYGCSPAALNPSAADEVETPSQLPALEPLAPIEG